MYFDKDNAGFPLLTTHLSTISKSNYNMVITTITVQESFYHWKSGTKHADTRLWPKAKYNVASNRKCIIWQRLWYIVDSYKECMIAVTESSGFIQEVHYMTAIIISVL